MYVYSYKYATVYTHKYRVQIDRQTLRTCTPCVYVSSCILQVYTHTIYLSIYTVYLCKCIHTHTQYATLYTHKYTVQIDRQIEVILCAILLIDTSIYLILCDRQIYLSNIVRYTTTQCRQIDRSIAHNIRQIDLSITYLPITSIYHRQIDRYKYSAQYFYQMHIRHYNIKCVYNIYTTIFTCGSMIWFM